MAVSYAIANDSLVSHSFNGDGTELAISVNSSDIHILSVPRSTNEKFRVIDVLKEHTALVTCIDWAPKTNKIVSCAIDSNAYVWNKNNEGKWKPVLVILMIHRAAICAKWSPAEDRFAVGSGSKVLSICSFDTEEDFWVSKKIKKGIKSTVTCLDWHPNNVVIACGSSDFRLRVYSASTKSGPAESVWGNHSTSGTLLFEHNSGDGGWVLDVSFSADGNKLVWVKHNSTIFVADATAGGGAGDGSSGPAVVACLRSEFLPFNSCVWVTPSTFVTAGYDCCPMVFRYANNEITFVHKLDVKGEAKLGEKISAMRKFQDIDRMATSDNTGSRLPTIHQNSINELRIYSGNRSKASKLSSIGRDGFLVFWDLPSLCERISQLKIF